MGSHGSKKRQKSSSSASTPSSEINSDDNGFDNTQVAHHHKQSSKKSGKMPFFRTQSESAKRRLEHLLYLGQESPEPHFDLSNCEMSELPSGQQKCMVTIKTVPFDYVLVLLCLHHMNLLKPEVKSGASEGDRVPASVFSMCKILNKEVLLLHDNWLSGMGSDVKLSSLKTLRVLDLHNNEVKVLPADICDISKLQVLNLENNKLLILPSSLEKLRHLQTLNIRGNKFKVFPEAVWKLKSLRLLDISDNHITVLPKQLCNVRTLETIVLDADKMKYPNAEICKQGTEAIMKFLCDESGIEYLPPSNFLLDVLDSPPGVSPSSTNNSINEALAEEHSLMKSLAEYNNQLERKRQERIEIERHLEEDQREQALLASQAQQNKKILIDSVAQDQDKFDKELEELAVKKEVERIKLVDDLREIEDGANDLIEKMLEVNERARKAEELLDIMEKERIEKEELFVVRWEEEQNLRKQEVLDAMKQILQETENFEELRQNYMDNKETVMKQALEDEEMMAYGQVESILYHREVEQAVMMDALQRQEQLQREAFEALQLQKDTKHQRITTQIALIQEELANLTIVEIEKRELRAEEEMNVVAEKRIELIGLLSQLMFEQEKRQGELKKRLSEMEQQKQDGQTDYWLVQYQRLMDRKPQALIDQEHQLEIAVVNILTDSSAQEYIPLFARHRITIETLLQITEDNLKQMGVHELGLRKNILRNLEHYRSKEEKSPDHPPPKMLPESKELITVPSAPPMTPSPTRQSSILARGLNTECVVCLDKQTDTIFLNCGHVCTCCSCSHQIEQCPLCRQEIIQRIRLMNTGT